MSNKAWYKKDEKDKVWWLDDPETVGVFIFSFNKEKEYNLFSDYPYKLSERERKIFDAENPEWKEFFSDRG